MDINLKKDNVKLQINVLSSKKNFKSWQQSFITYTSTMKLKYMISHKVHDPAMKLAEPEDFMNNAELVELRNKAMANNTELPEDLAILIPQGLRVLMHECNILKVHPRMSVQGVSKDIIVLILNADVIICDDLYVLFDEAEDFLNFQSTMDANVAKIFTVFYSLWTYRTYSKKMPK